MAVSQTQTKASGSNIIPALISGAVAPVMTQPLEVIKTNKINSGAVYKDVHRNIVSKGWLGYMRGGSLAAFKQAYGFTIYTTLLDVLRKYADGNFPHLNKYLNYSVTSLSSKFIAMLFEAPITLLKTRLEWLGS